MMKIFLILLLVFSVSSVFAEDDSKDSKNKIVIINGKKFFPLSGARTFSGSVKPMSSVKFPRVQHMPMAHNNAPRESEIHLPDNIGSKSAAGDEIPPADNTTGNISTDGKTKSDVLSVFEPEGK